MLSFTILLPVELLRKHHIFMNVDFLCSDACCLLLLMLNAWQSEKKYFVCSSLWFWHVIYQFLFVLKDGNICRSCVVFIQLSLTNTTPCWSPNCFQNIFLRYSRCVRVASRFMAAALFTRTSWFQSSGLYRNMLTFVKILWYDGSFFQSPGQCPGFLQKFAGHCWICWTFCPFASFCDFIRVRRLRWLN